MSIPAVLFQQDDGTIAIVVAVLAALIGLAVAVLMIAAIWKLFSKANEPGWASIIPIYNLVVALRIIGRPWWLVLIMLIPGAQIVVGVILALGLARSFGKETGFAIGMLFLPEVFIPILAFGDATYQGPSA
jgi:Na+-translocating ferredoxin:NAD+ oxidoreductase RnfE subunit